MVGQVGPFDQHARIAGTAGIALTVRAAAIARTAPGQDGVKGVDPAALPRQVDDQPRVMGSPDAVDAEGAEALVGDIPGHGQDGMAGEGQDCPQVRAPGRNALPAAVGRREPPCGCRRDDDG
jgi:hypothetical protein